MKFYSMTNSHQISPRACSQGLLTLTARLRKKNWKDHTYEEVCSDMFLNEMGGGEIPIHLFAHRLLFHSERIIGLFS